MNDQPEGARREFYVGQTLWFVPTRGQNHEVTITKVGRKWCGLDLYRGRLDMSSLFVIDGVYTLGKCYPSHDEYEKIVAADKAWSVLRRRLPYRRPKSVSISAIRQAAELLGIKIEGDEG